ncbi:MAG: sugar ABC transporter permease [Tenericutes bacterium]|nr:sugar ABC transporter permease [Mycoplasmatota bacterium]
MKNEKQSFKAYKMKQKVIPYLFLTPNLLIFSIFIILPALIGLYYSFTDVNLFHMNEFSLIGFQNYVRLFKDAEFLAALWNTVKLVVVSVPIIFVSAMAIAMLIVQPLRAKGFYRATYYWPVMISAIVVGIIWNWILGGSFGLFNTFITKLGFAESDTLINPNFAWWSIVLAIVWSRTGYYMIIFMAALLSIPESLYEASDMDGANKVQKFRFITYPSLRAARLMVFILVTMEVFKTYPIVVKLTAGGPSNATTYTVQYIYETAFSTTYDVGYASAMSMILLLFVTILTAANFFLNKGGTD